MAKIIDITTAKNTPFWMHATTQISYSHDHWFTPERKPTVISFKKEVPCHTTNDVAKKKR